jgi:hypothetical protein
MDSLDERCLLSAFVVTHLDQAVRPSALAAPIVQGPEPAPSGGVARAVTPPLSHNPGASSSATNGGARGTSNSPATSTGPTASSITELSPNLFATPLATTTHPAVSAPPTAQSAAIPLGSSSAPATAGSFGRSLPASQEQVLLSAHLDQEDDLVDNEETPSAVDEEKQAEPFIKIIEKPKATAPAKAPEQRSEPAPAPPLVPIVPDENLESVFNVLECGLLTKLLEAGSTRPESAPDEPDSSPGLFAMIGAAALSTGAFPLATPLPNLTLRRRVERRHQSKLKDQSRTDGPVY